MVPRLRSVVIADDESA